MEELSKILLGLLLASRALSPISDGGGAAGQSFSSFVGGPGRSEIVMVVLPFENLSADPNASKKVTNNIVSYLAGKNVYGVVESNRVEKALMDAGVRAMGDIDREKLNKLREDLGAQIALLGIITEFGETRMQQDSFPIISINLRLLDTRTADILWTSSITKVGGVKSSLFRSGKTIPMPTLTQSLSNEVSAQLERQQKALKESLSQSAPPVAASAPAEDGQTVAAAPGSGPAPAALQAAPEPASSDYANAPAEKAMNDGDLAALLGPVSGFEPAKPTTGKAIHSYADSLYKGDKGALRVKVTDYQTADLAKRFVEHYVGGGEPLNVSGATAYFVPGEMGSAQIGASFGQLGVFIVGQETRKEEMTAFLKGFLKAVSAQ